MILPHYRGPNNNPQACASKLAIQDVLDAVDYATQHACIDRRRVYLAGQSGGGHMALMMAARAPHVWAGVSAWVPITDLAAWHTELTRKQAYAKQLEQICGGSPGTPEADRQYRARSPLFHLAAARGLPIDINRRNSLTDTAARCSLVTLCEHSTSLPKPMDAPIRC